MKKRKYLVIHCADTPNSLDFTGEDIRRWHTDDKPRGNGWKQVGYEAVIRRDGKLDILVEDNGDNIVDPWEVTNGARGVNSISSHVCLIGGITEDGKSDLEMTDEQRHTLIGWIKDKIVQQQDIKIAGHHHFSSKTCPNFAVEDFLEEINCSEENIYRK